MHKMLRLPEPCKPASFHVPFALVGVVCLLLVSLPNGGSANSYVETNLVSNTDNPGASSTTNLTEAKLAEAAHDVRLRPRSIAKNVSHLRLLKRQARLPNFANLDETELSLNTASISTDPRVQHNGKTWQFSESFVSQVGADPWTLAGVGFPNIETHDEKIENNYKPYAPLIDWTSADANEGEWVPIPAVRCGGLSSQKIADRVKRHEREILSYSIKYGVSASLVKAVITKESCFDTKAISKVGAEGLMQLMPDTARWLKVTDRTDVSQNLSAGIRYLSDLRKRFGTEELALAAYNAGPGNVERYGGIPPFKETQQYVTSVMTFYQRYAAATRFANQRVSN